MAEKECVKINGTRKCVGQLNNIDHIDVTDPCYGKNIAWFRQSNMPIERGDYNCYVWRDDEDYVSAIAIIKDDVDIDKIRLSEGKDSSVAKFDYHVGNIGVDSGLAGFFVDKPDYDDNQWNDFCNEVGGHDHVVTENMFVSETGYGDGGYPVYVWFNEKEEPIGVAIVYIDE